MRQALTQTAAAWLHWPETLALVEAFHTAGYPLRFVGGAVRDTLLGREVVDVDAATPAPPQKVMAIAEAAGMKAIPTGLSHGTVTVVVSLFTAQGAAQSGGGSVSDGGVSPPNHKIFEITTLRRDIKNFGRHAEVLFTNSWEEDAARRDFTMNALYAEPDGTVHDYFGGVEDAQTGRVVFIGEACQRIQEDALRILRFFRFFASYGEGNADAVALAACAQESFRLNQLSAERIGAEMLKLLQADRAAETLRLMQDYGILEKLISATVEVSSVAALRRVRLMAEPEPMHPLVPLALLLRSWPYPEAVLEDVVKRWRLSGKQAVQLRHLTQEKRLEPETLEAEQKKILRKEGAELFAARVMIGWAERLAENPPQPQILSATYRAMMGLPARWEIPIFPLSGEDLRGIGMISGPQMGQALRQLESQWEAADYQLTPQKLLEHARQWMG